MKRAIVLGIIILGGVVLEAYAQCERTHFFCSSQLSKEEQHEIWNVNNQSKSAAVAKGQKYDLTFIAYTGYDYRLTLCTNAVAGSGEKVNFTLSQDAVKAMSDGTIQRRPEVIYDNASDGNKSSIKFATDKTRKIYLSVDVPSSGDSKDKSLGMEDKVCLGVLIEHRKTPDLGFK